MSSEESAGERLSALLKRLVGRKDVMHAIAAVESGNGSFRWAAAFGDSSSGGAPIRTDTPFFLASIDKLYNAAVILKLHERGLVSLDEPLTSYLPMSLVGGLHQLEGVDYTNRIALRHLLAHTSGLADWLEDHPKGDVSLVEHLLREGDRAVTIEELVSLVRDRLTPHFPPQPVDASRPRVRYCDTNFMLIIAIIEVVTGRPLHQVHAEMLYEPLGLRHTWIAGHSRPLDPAGEPAALYGGTRPLEIPLMMRSFWGMYSTAQDTLSFLRALIGGQVFEREETFSLMQGRWNRFGIPRDRAALRSPQWPVEYGLGMMRFRLPRILTPLYAVPALVGHTGSTGSWLFHCQKEDLLLSGTVDQATAGALPFRFVPRLVRALGLDAAERTHAPL